MAAITLNPLTPSVPESADHRETPSVPASQTSGDFSRALLDTTQLPTNINRSGQLNLPGDFLIAGKGKKLSDDGYQEQRQVLQDMLGKKFNSLKVDKQTLLLTLMTNEKASYEKLAKQLYGSSSVQNMKKLDRTIQQIASTIDRKLGNTVKENKDMMRFLLDLLAQFHVYGAKLVKSNKLEKSSLQTHAESIISQVSMPENEKMVWGLHVVKIKHGEAIDYEGLKLGESYDFSHYYDHSRFIQNKEYMDLSEAKQKKFDDIILRELYRNDGSSLNYDDEAELKRYGQIVLTLVRDDSMAEDIFEQYGWDMDNATNQHAKMFTYGMRNITSEQIKLLQIYGLQYADREDIAGDVLRRWGEQLLVVTLSKNHPDWVEGSRYFGQDSSAQLAEAAKTVIDGSNQVSRLIGTAETAAQNVQSDSDLKAVTQTLGQLNQLIEDMRQATETVDVAARVFDLELLYQEIDPQQVNTMLEQAENAVENLQSFIDEKQQALEKNKTEQEVDAVLQQMSQLEEQLQTDGGQIASTYDNLSGQLTAADVVQASDSLAEATALLDQMQQSVMLIQQQAMNIRSQVLSYPDLAQYATTATAKAEQAGMQLKTAQSQLGIVQWQLETASLSAEQQQQRQAQLDDQRGAADFALYVAFNASSLDYEDFSDNIKELLFQLWVNPNTSAELIINRFVAGEEVDKSQVDAIVSAMNLDDSAQLGRFISGLRAIEENAGIRALIASVSNGSSTVSGDDKTEWTNVDAKDALLALLIDPSAVDEKSAQLLELFAEGYAQSIGLWRLVAALEQSSESLDNGYKDLADGFRLDEQLDSLPELTRNKVAALESVAAQHLIWLLNDYSPEELVNMGVPENILKTTVNELELEGLITPELLYQHLRTHRINETPARPPGYFKIGAMGSMPVVNSSQVITAFELLGFKVQTGRGKGDHIQLEGVGRDSEKVTVSLQSGKAMVRHQILRDMLKNAQITVDQFKTLLQGKVPEDLWSEGAATESAEVNQGTDNNAGAAEGITDSLNTDSQSASDPMSQHKAEDRQLFSTKDNAKNGEYDRNASGIKPLEKKSGMIGVVPDISGAIKDSKPLTEQPQETGVPSQSIEYSPPVIKPPSIDITQTDPVESPPGDYNTLPDHIQSVLPESVYQASGLNAAEVNARYEMYNQLHPEVRGEFSVFVKLHSNTIDLLRTRSAQVGVQNAELNLHNEKALAARQLQQQLTQLQTTPTAINTPEPKTQPASMERITLSPNTPPAYIIRNNLNSTQNNIVGANLSGRQHAAGTVNTNAAEIPMISLRGKQGSVVNSFISADSIPQYMLRNTQTGLQLHAVIEKPNGELAFISIPNIKIPAGAKATQFNIRAQRWDGLPQLSQQQLNNAQAYLQSIQQTTIIPAAPTTGAPVNGAPLNVPGGLPVSP